MRFITAALLLVSLWVLASHNGLQWLLAYVLGWVITGVCWGVSDWREQEARIDRELGLSSPAGLRDHAPPHADRPTSAVPIDESA
jgi:hypothetical protein